LKCSFSCASLNCESNRSTRIDGDRCRQRILLILPQFNVFSVLIRPFCGLSDSQSGTSLHLRCCATLVLFYSRPTHSRRNFARWIRCCSCNFEVWL